MSLKTSPLFRFLTQERFGQLVTNPTHIKGGEQTIKYPSVLKLIGSRPILKATTCYSKFIATNDNDTVHLETLNYTISEQK